MKKKLLLSFLALIIFIFPVSNALFPQEADAFVSKLFGLTAKKIAKEAVKDMAVETATNFALNEAFKIADAQMAKYNQKEAYKIVCLQALTGEVCDKPVAIKENLTEADKIAIGRQAEIELEKSINGGAGFTKWQKFLDWFGPVWITSFVMTAVTYAIDSDVRSLFNEIAYDSLVALGIIAPVESNEPIKIEEHQTPAPSLNVNVNNSEQISYTSGYTSTPVNISNNYNPAIAPTNLLVQLIAKSPSQKFSGFSIFANADLPVELVGDSFYMQYGTMGVTQYVNLIDNDGNITTLTASTKSNGYDRFVIPTTELNKIKSTTSNMTSIIYRPPFKKDGYYYSDFQIRYQDSTKYTIQTKHSMYYSSVTQLGFRFFTASSFSNTPQYTNVTFFNQSPSSKIYPPQFAETTFDALPHTTTFKEDHLALVPPLALPYKKISDGTPVYPETNPDYDPVTNPDAEPKRFVDGNGNPVPDDDITIGDPDIQNNPDPTKTGKVAIPPPSPSNPSPQPIPLTPTIPTTPPPPPTPIETEAPVFPVGESCDVGLKIPKIKPLTNAVTTAFPFSIPYDLYQGFQALFSEIGNEKPVFKYKVNFLGDVQEWEIAIPDYFDAWKVFTDSLLIFVFDVGLIYAIYRFMGGGS